MAILLPICPRRRKERYRDGTTYTLNAQSQGALAFDSSKLLTKGRVLVEKVERNGQAFSSSLDKFMQRGGRFNPFLYVLSVDDIELREDTSMEQLIGYLKKNAKRRSEQNPTKIVLTYDRQNFEE